MGMIAFTSTDTSAGTIYVNPDHVVYVVNQENCTAIGTTVPTKEGAPWAVFVKESAEEVCKKLRSHT